MLILASPVPVVTTVNRISELFRKQTPPQFQTRRRKGNAFHRADLRYLTPDQYNLFYPDSTGATDTQKPVETISFCRETNAANEALPNNYRQLRISAIPPNTVPGGKSTLSKASNL